MGCTISHVELKWIDLHTLEGCYLVGDKVAIKIEVQDKISNLPLLGDERNKEMNAISGEVRWQQRFANYNKAFARFNEVKEVLNKDINNKIIQMALIQTFEFTYELGWKVIKDFLKYNGIDVKLPREVIKEGFAAGIITDGQAWIDMMSDRNATSHTYNEEFALQIIHNILSKYSIAFGDLQIFLSGKLDG